MKIKHSTINFCPNAAHVADISGPSPSVDMIDEENYLDYDIFGLLHISKSVGRWPEFSQKIVSADKDVSCPFCNATGQLDVKKIMMQVPPSHVQRMTNESKTN